jgi:hypothetical protein
MSITMSEHCDTRQPAEPGDDARPGDAAGGAPIPALIPTPVPAPASVPADEPCEVLRGVDGPVYVLRAGLLHVVHEVLGRWLEPEAERAGAGGYRITQDSEVEHWLVTASLGRFGHPEVFHLQCRPAPPALGPTQWTVRPERGRRR